MKIPMTLAKCLLCVSILAAAPPPAEPLAPAERWVVSFDDAQCVASRAYGEGNARFNLLLKLSPMGGVIQLAIVKPGWRSEPGQVAARVEADGRTLISTNALVFQASASNAERRVVHLINMPMEAFAPVRNAAALTVALDGKAELLKLFQVDQVMRTMDRCLADLQGVWNIGPDRVARLKTSAQPKRPLAAFVFDRDYPHIAASKDQSGITGFVLLIDEEGKVADCTVEQTSGTASLDAQSCIVIRTRAKFSPAIDQDGKAVKSAIATKIHWVLDS